MEELKRQLKAAEDLIAKMRKRLLHQAIAFFVLWLVGGFFVWLFQHELDQRFSSGQVHACHRLNITRIADNKSQHTDYQFFTQAGNGLLVAAGKKNKEAKKFAEKLLQDAQQKSWTAPANCRLALKVDYTETPTYQFYLRDAPPSAYSLTTDQ